MLLVQLPQIHTESIHKFFYFTAASRHVTSLFHLSLVPRARVTLIEFDFPPEVLIDACVITLDSRTATPLNKRVDWNGITGTSQDKHALFLIYISLPLSIWESDNACPGVRLLIYCGISHKDLGV